MTIRAAIEGNLSAHIKDQWSMVGKATSRGFREAGKGMVGDLKQDATSARLGKLGKAWKFRTYRSRKSPFENVAFVYAKGGERTRGALRAFSYGAEVRSQKGRFLLIPTGFNLKKGRRGGRVLYQPNELTGAFVRKSANGQLLLFAPVQKGSRKVNGKIREQAYVNDKLLGSGRIKRSREILKHRAVPMFILVPKTSIKKRLNTNQIAQKWQTKAVGLVIKYWNQLDG